MPQSLSILWDTFLINPMVNVTIVLARLLFNNYGLAIIVFTLIMRGLTLPLTLRQVHSQRKMSQLQPQLNEISKRVKDPKKRSAETMQLYKEAGASPAGCLLPMLIQFPIWIALYDVIRTVLGSTPETLLDLSGRLYNWSFIQQAVPLGNQLLFWDVGKSAQDYVGLGGVWLAAGASIPVLVGASMWIQQKLTMTQASMTAANQNQAQTNQTLLYMMPLMFGYFTLNVPIGLALYWLITNAIGIIMNYYVFGWKGTSLIEILLKSPSSGQTPGGRGRTGGPARGSRSDRGQSARTAGQAGDAGDVAQGGSRAEKRGANGRNGRGGNKRKDNRGGARPGAEPTRSGTKPGGGGSP